MTTVGTPTDERDESPSAQVGRWFKEFDACRKREAAFLKQGKEVLDIYEGGKDNEDGVSTMAPFNIVFSNTETLLPAIYSSVPRPVVQRRFKDDDPIGKAAAQTGQRGLEFILDTNMEGYETVDDGLAHSTLNALLPGRGGCSVKYDADMAQAPAKEGEEPVDVLQWELVCVETSPWNKVLYGYATKWSQVPWIAYEKDIDKAEATRLFGQAVAEKLVYSDSESVGRADQSKAEKAEPHRGERKTVRIHSTAAPGATDRSAHAWAAAESVAGPDATDPGSTAGPAMVAGVGSSAKRPVPRLSRGAKTVTGTGAPGDEWGP